MYEKIKPKFAKRYLNLSEEITNAVSSYKNEVQTSAFPMDENSFSIDEAELKKLREEIGN